MHQPLDAAITPGADMDLPSELIKAAYNDLILEAGLVSEFDSDAVDKVMAAITVIDVEPEVLPSAAV